MSSFIVGLSVIATHDPILTFLILYIAIIFLGNLSVFVGFWIILHSHLGWWGLPVLFVVTLLSDFTGDVLWYSFGRAVRNHRLGNWIMRHIPKHDRIMAHLQKNGARWVFMSKFLYATTFPIIFSVGWSDFDFKKFIRVSITSILVWIPIVFLLAFIFVSGVTPFRGYAEFRHLERLFFLGILGFLAANFLMSFVVRKVLQFLGYGSDDNEKKVLPEANKTGEVALETE